MKNKLSLGLRARSKLVVQGFVAVVVAAVLIYTEDKFPLYVPFYKFPIIQNMGIYFVFLAILVIVGSSNAVNLTDGLDGLAIFPTMTCAFTYGIFSYIVGHALIANYLHLQFIPGTGELAIVCGAMVAAGL